MKITKEQLKKLVTEVIQEQDYIPTRGNSTDVFKRRNDAIRDLKKLRMVMERALSISEGRLMDSPEYRAELVALIERLEGSVHSFNEEIHSIIHDWNY